jgi:beta-phosphoglucomutase
MTGSMAIKTGIEALIFDLDGVLLNSMPAHVAAWGEAFREEGLKVSEEFIYRNEGALDWDLLRRELQSGNGAMSRAMFEALIDRQREIYLRGYAPQVQMYSEAREVVETLGQSHLRLALVTSSARMVLLPSLVSWIDSHFQVVVTGESVNRCKPHPEPYLKSLEALGIGPEQAVVVENAPAGIRSARRAGIFCIALATTLPPEALAEADHICPDHRAFMRWLRTAQVF